MNANALVGGAFNQVLRDCENFADGSLAALIQTVWRWILVSGGGAGGIYHPHTGHSTHVLYLETVFKLKHLLPNVSMSSCQPTGCPISKFPLCFCHFLGFWSTYRGTSELYSTALEICYILATRIFKFDLEIAEIIEVKVGTCKTKIIFFDSVIAKC